MLKPDHYLTFDEFKETMSHQACPSCENGLNHQCSDLPVCKEECYTLYRLMWEEVNKHE
jgi:hypothetical protein